MSDIKIVDWPKRPAEQRRDQLERENAELRKLLKELRQRLNKGFLRLDEWQISDMVKLIDAALKAAERDREWRL